MRVLIVEDEALVAMMVEGVVLDFGAIVVGIAASLPKAIEMATTMMFDAALLDLNLGGQKAHAVPAILKSRGIPFAFVTGYGGAGVLAEFADAPVVPKPFEARELMAALRTLASKTTDVCNPG